MANTANNTKMKGLLKGLRYISQIFDDNKGQDMQIGFPTDVKHVAHIGWEGPSTAAGSPSWMNEFQAPPGHSSGPLSNGETKEDPGVKWVSQDSSRKGSSRGARSPAQDTPDLPRASPRQTSSGHGDGGIDSPKKERSDKPKQTRRSSKNRDTTDSITRGIRQSTESINGSESPQNQPEIPKKTRRKKSKDSSVGGYQERLNPMLVQKHVQILDTNLQLFINVIAKTNYLKILFKRGKTRDLHELLHKIDYWCS